MIGSLRTIVALGTAAMMSMSPVLAAESLGIYQTSDRKMDYELNLCGDNGKNLCVTLLAARGSAATGQVKPYIGKHVVSNAKPSGNNKWKGKMRVGQYELNGSLTLTPGKKFVMSGCVYVVICDDFTLIPAE
ncbi:MAG: hypothetical protein EOP22_13190 [Hyphomicrobiales bacterium]|nr:MAG: hypothetical protein EOP22_13190 [Hyphomicrobiales bacterium]